MPSARSPSRCSPMASSIRRRAESSVFPVATQPGRSGTEAPQSLSGSRLMRTRYRSVRAGPQPLASRPDSPICTQSGLPKRASRLWRCRAAGTSDVSKVGHHRLQPAACGSRAKDRVDRQCAALPSVPAAAMSLACRRSLGRFQCGRETSPWTAATIRGRRRDERAL